MNSSRSSADGGRRGEIYAQAEGIARQIRGPDSRALSEIPRRVSGYNLDELLPENGFHVARALVGIGGTLRHDSRSDAAADSQPAGALAAGARLSRCLSAPAIT